MITPEGPQEGLERRIAGVIREYEKQGFHRTGTEVDKRSGDWLYEQVRRMGLEPARGPFSLDRINPIETGLIVGDRRIEGLPLFDGTFTDAEGIRGELGPVGSDAEIGLVEAAPNTASSGLLGEVRKRPKYKALVCVTRGGQPGLCANNADAFLNPFGPPVLQVSSEESSFLAEQANLRTKVCLTASVERVRGSSFNVTTKIAGVDPILTPLIIMTPRSGWYACASERGGGLAVWLELMRVLRSPEPPRDILFVASSGHELGHLGIHAFVDHRPGIISESAGWIHLGANIGAAMGPSNNLQASDDEFEGLLCGAMTASGLCIGRRKPRGKIAGGEAQMVHLGGGRYVSIIGSNALFHNPKDKGPEAVDLSVIARFVKASAAVAEAMMAN